MISNILHLTLISICIWSPLSHDIPFWHSLLVFMTTNVLGTPNVNTFKKHRETKKHNNCLEVLGTPNLKKKTRNLKKKYYC